MTTYKDAGVDIEANANWIESIKAVVQKTHSKSVISEHGSFSGVFEVQGIKLAACADGVGTKTIIAAEMNDFTGIGKDLVAMNVNDLLCCGATPLFFLDYLAVAAIQPKKHLELMESIAAGCIDADCVLLGGETAEMSDMYDPRHIDVAGFAVGLVGGYEYGPKRVRDGQELIGLPSSGLHSNGYSLVRRLIVEHGISLEDDFRGQNLYGPLGIHLLQPTEIYVKSVKHLLDRFPGAVAAMAHITGGGLPENVGRVLPPNCDAIIRKESWKRDELFDFVQKLGVSEEEMYKVFNMGIGFVLIIDADMSATVKDLLSSCGEHPVTIGYVKEASGKVKFE